MISSARAKMPGLLGTTRRLCGDSQRNQRDHCRRRGSTGRSRPCRARESATIRVIASIFGAPWPKSLRGSVLSLLPCLLSLDLTTHGFLRRTDALVAHPGEGSEDGHRTSKKTLSGFQLLILNRCL